MKKYAANGLSGSSTTQKTAALVTAATNARPMVSEFSIGIRTAPNTTDQQVNAAVTAPTTYGTPAGTSQTPKPLDLVDPVASLVSTLITLTTEPTTYPSTYFWNGDLNQRGLFRWVAEIGFELAVGAATSAAIGFIMAAATSALQMSAPVHWKE